MFLCKKGIRNQLSEETKKDLKAFIDNRSNKNYKLHVKDIKNLIGGKLMARILKNKELLNTRLATNYGGWMYCNKCNENIGYLCYSTYDRLELKYKCNCGSDGKILLDFEDSKTGKECKDELITIKNRLCCPRENDPLITILDKKVTNYEMKITCKSCQSIYKKIK